MSVMVLSRRVITFRENTSGEVNVLLVPGHDQIQVVKDLAGINDLANAQTSSARGPQLARVFSGQRYIYGYLPEEVRELRQAVKVWLAEDFAPADTQAFFYVFSPEVIIHGVREQSDEGQQSWRTAQLVLPGKEPVKALTNAITDYVLANPGAKLTVAVLNQLEMYRALQRGLEAYQIAPIPFSTLRPLPGLRPLYRHLDHTLIYLTGALFGVLTLIAAATFWFVNFSEAGRLDEQIQETQDRIKAIQINQSTGHIHRPQNLLDAMAKAFNQQPSAIIHAAASAAAMFGELRQVTFKPLEFAASASANSPDHQTVEVIINDSHDKLLFTQERRAERLQENRPWIRSIERVGTPGDQAQLTFSLRTEGAAEPTPQILAMADTPISLTEVVTPTEVTATVAAPVPLVISETAPAAQVKP